MPPGPVVRRGNPSAQITRTRLVSRREVGIMMPLGHLFRPAHGAVVCALTCMAATRASCSGTRNTSDRRPTLATRIFFPMFTAAKWDPDAWAKLVQDAEKRNMSSQRRASRRFFQRKSDINKFKLVQLRATPRSRRPTHRRVRKGRLKTGVPTTATRISISSRRCPAAISSIPNGRRFTASPTAATPAYARFVETCDQQEHGTHRQVRPDMLWFDFNRIDQLGSAKVRLARITTPRGGVGKTRWPSAPRASHSGGV